ncbi:rhodanese-related sulfurtransferase [Hyaloraphidium curvatum]|nr:rhodanese-related sulfurtransferase [Hyaloraphidium curvatum]
MAAPLLVSTEWLAANLNVVVLDGTWHLPRLGRDALAEYRASHIPGALFFDIEEHKDKSTNLPHMKPPKEVFDAAVGALGISEDSHVVVYDTYGVNASPRVWWTFREFGHEKVSVLDGGLPKWIAEGRPVESGEPKVTPTRYSSNPPPPTWVSYEDVKGTYALPRTEQLIIDGRPAARFDGTGLEPRPYMPSGHIPGAVSIPALEFVTKDGVLVSDDRLKAAFEKVGVEFSNPDQVLVTMCGSGVAAAGVSLYLAKLGVPFERMRLYDGSWIEWCWNGGPVESEGPINDEITKEAIEKGIVKGGPGSA